MTIEIVAATLLHIGPMIAGMAANERASRRQLRVAFRESSYRRTALLDGKAAAMWGVTGPLLATSGFVWLVFAERARSVSPRIIVDLVREELAEMCWTKDVLETLIPVSDARAIRFARFLGFEVEVADETGHCIAVLRANVPIDMAA